MAHDSKAYKRTVRATKLRQVLYHLSKQSNSDEACGELVDEMLPRANYDDQRDMTVALTTLVRHFNNRRDG